MATTVFRLFWALAVAAMVFLPGCGGGDEPSAQSTRNQAATQAAAVALAGSAAVKGSIGDLVGQPRMKVLSAPAFRSVAAPGPTIDFSFVLANSRSGAKPAAALAAAAPEPPVFDKVVDYLEQVLPDLFPGHEQSFLLEGTAFTVRQYDLPGGHANFVGTADGRLYGYGQFNEYKLIDYGSVCDSARQFIDANACAPRVESANLVSVTTGQMMANVLSGNPTVSAKGTKLVVKFASPTPISCAGIGGTLELGDEPKILVTATCDGETGTITLTPADSWLYGTVDTLTLSGITSRDGYVMRDLVTVTFTTKAVVSAPTLYVGGMIGIQGERSLHVLNPATGQIMKQLDLSAGNPGEEWSFGSVSLLADTLTGQLVVMPWIAHHLYTVDLENHGVKITDQDPGVGYVTEGMFLRGNDFCTAITRSLPWGAMNNQLRCWSRTTKKESFTTTNDFLAETAMRTFKIRNMTTPTPKVYLVNGVQDAYDNSTGNWLPGTKGELRVLNPTTFALERKVPVGSVPVDFAVHPASGDVWVINGGDRSLSIVRPSDRRAEDVETIPLVGYDTRGNQRPSGIVMDVAKNQVYITDGYRTVFVYDLRTRTEKAQIAISPTHGPGNIALVGDKLYVSNLHYEGGLLMTINRDTLAVTRTVPGLGLMPNSVVLFPSP